MTRERWSKARVALMCTVASALSFGVSYGGGASDSHGDTLRVGAVASAQGQCGRRGRPPESCRMEEVDDHGCCPIRGRGDSAQEVWIRVESNPPGAEVLLDGEDGRLLGTTPVRRVRVPRGAHSLIFRLARHRETTLQVTVRRSTTFRAVLDPLASIAVSAANDDAQGASVRVDGQNVGVVPSAHTVEPGRHLVEVLREGHVTFRQWVQLSGGQQLQLPVLLERESPRTGSVLVAADISGAPIYVDGERHGSTPSVIDNIEVGVHRIEVRSEALGSRARAIEVVAGERLNVVFRFRP